MPWSYSQSTGILKHANVQVDIGYSGAGKSPATGRNNPQLQNVVNNGPIPQGEWTIGPASTHPKLGPIVMALTPVGHNALGRTAFLIHGDNSTNDASQGCIILRPQTRQRIASSTDRKIIVTP